MRRSMSTLTNGRPVDGSTSTTTSWSVHDASELYEVARWGNGYFSINAGWSRPGPSDEGRDAGRSTSRS